MVFQCLIDGNPNGFQGVVSALLPVKAVENMGAESAFNEIWHLVLHLGRWPSHHSAGLPSPPLTLP